MHKMTIKNSHNCSVLCNSSPPHLFLELTTLCQYHGRHAPYDSVLMKVTYFQVFQLLRYLMLSYEVNVSKPARNSSSAFLNFLSDPRRSVFICSVRISLLSTALISLPAKSSSRRRVLKNSYLPPPFSCDDGTVDSPQTNHISESLYVRINLCGVEFITTKSLGKKVPF